MNTTSRAGWLLAASLLAASWLTAQNSVQDDLQRADKQFDLYAYNLALRTYEQVLQKDPNNARALSRTADSYFQLNRIEESLPWYDRAAQQYNVEPLTFLNYGKALMQTGDYVGAKKWFRVYGENNPSAAQQYINMCDYAIEVSKKEAIYTVKNEPLNTESADFCATFMGSRVVLSSSRTDIVRKAQPKSSSDWSGGA
ncbi:MAG TPA: tetratricopeptide repeat protein, partial [Saprospiraceae bacterium]|nr:tetratricopeptide repeat protein [Saprospiraceae bacterium]